MSSTGDGRHPEIGEQEERRASSSNVPMDVIRERIRYAPLPREMDVIRNITITRHEQTPQGQAERAAMARYESEARARYESEARARYEQTPQRQAERAVMARYESEARARYEQTPQGQAERAAMARYESEARARYEQTPQRQAERVEREVRERDQRRQYSEIEAGNVLMSYINRIESMPENDPNRPPDNSVRENMELMQTFFEVHRSDEPAELTGRSRGITHLDRWWCMSGQDRERARHLVDQETQLMNQTSGTDSSLHS